jgi:predicted  nucleic acid-binding Zn-ribbon protein
MASAEFDPQNCPVGITNEKNVEKLGDKLDLMIQRLDEKMDGMKEDIASLSDKIDKNSSDMDKRFDSLEKKVETELEEVKKGIPETVDKKIEDYKNKQAGAIIKWVFSGVIGTVFVAIITSWITGSLGL